jgi:A/G-specific adenine glycosylase
MTDPIRRTVAHGGLDVAPNATPLPAERLIAWFGAHRRDLPWRTDRHPYRVWISEVMLQQTRADTVTDYFERFVTRFPDVHALAAAPLEDVLKAWQGLGYYRRARMLHAAAGIVAREHGGRLPASVERLRRLPGFGPYTANAVAALAFGLPVIAVDANVRRVGARFFGQESPDDRAIEAGFTQWLATAPGDASARAGVTEGLIELGALVCTPKDPACPTCPLRLACRAALTESPEDFGRASPRRSVETRRRYASVRFDDAGLWLAKRPLDGLLGGMWGFPQTESPPAGRELGTVTHVYTHFRLELVMIEIAPDMLPESHDEPAVAAQALQPEHVMWSRIDDLPISGVDMKVLDHLHTMASIGASERDRAARAMMTP